MMPAGSGEVEPTMPLLLEDTVRRWVAGGTTLKLAVTERAALMVTWQVGVVPGQVTLLALQPVKAKPLAGVAVSVTVVPALKLAAQAAVQLPIPLGAELTVPLPLAATVTCNWYWLCACGLKVATAVTLVP